MSRFWSPSTGGFYTTDIHGDAVPADAVKISAGRHLALLEAHNAGADIVAGPRGPVAVMPKAERSASLATAIRRVKREARRRCLEVASIERQSNDNAALVLAAAGDPEFEGAVERRRQINAIRAASNAIESDLNDLADDALVEFDPANSERWPQGTRA
jgi:hypothetical protein